MNLFEVAVTSLAVTLAATPLCMYVAKRLQAVDHPGPLKPQSAPIPYFGGVAVLLGLLASLWNRPALLGPLALAAAIGVADDVADLPPVVRLLGQGMVGLLIAAVVTTRLPAGAAISLGILVTVVLMNGVNMVDGIDSLATALVATSALGFVILEGGAPREVALAVVLASAGFLVYNRPPARVYLGDGGSYLLGAVLAELLALSWGPGARPSVGVGALLLVVVPAAELGVTVLRRARGGRKLVTGDRSHSYDRMVARGASVPVVVAAFVGVQVALGAVAVGIGASGSLVVAVAVAAVVSAALVVAAVVSGLLVAEGRTPK